MPVPTLVSIRLDEPDKGEKQLTHDQTFETWDEAFSTTRDIVNRGIDVVNKAGAGLPRLPEGSLEEMLILPLTGDYRTIGQNAMACADTRDALHRWADNLLRLSVAVEPDWGGEAASAYLLRVNALGLAGRGLGETVKAGAIVYEQLATFSERIAIEVEHLVVELGKTLVRLARRILSKVSGPAGWAAFAADLMMHGLDAVMDIVDDVQRVVKIIETLRELYDAVVDWVHTMQDKLELFRSLPSLVRG